MAKRRKSESLGDGLAGRAFTKRGPKVELDFLLPTRGPSAGAEPVVEPAPAPAIAPEQAPVGFLPAPMPAPAPDAPVFEAPPIEVADLVIDELVEVPDLTVSEGGSRLGLAILEADEPTLELWLIEAAPASTPRPTPPPQPTIVWPALLLPAPTWTPPRWTPAAPPHPTRWRDRALRHVERFVSRVLRVVF